MISRSFFISAAVVPLLFFSILLLSCSPLSGYQDLSDADYQPPVLLVAETTGRDRYLLEFSEPVQAGGKPMLLIGDAENSVVMEIRIEDTEKHVVILSTEPYLGPGEEGVIRGSVADNSGNRIHFTTVVYGWNDSVPPLLINEFTTQGSASSPDRVELIVLGSGNTAGVTFLDGIDTEYRQKVVLPPIEVEKGDFIIIHCGKEEPIPYPSAETEAKDQINLPTASPSAWDVWIEEGIGLSGNNGVITLYSSPRGSLIDGVLYSNRSSDSDTRYEGFGSTALLEQSRRLLLLGGWKGTDDSTLRPQDGILRPQDGINPDDSTATRSMCRVNYGDTDTQSDWHIVPTRGSTFGKQNSSEVYTP